MNKFQQLIKTLQTELIILIDDDFIPVTDTQEILTFICFMNPVDRKLMLKRLTTIENTLIAPLNQLIDGIDNIEIKSDDKQYIEAGLLSDLLNNKDEDTLLKLAKELIETIDKSDNKDDIENLGMMYGLRPSAGTDNYSDFFEVLEVFDPKKSIRLYKGLEGTEFTSFENEIREVNQAKNNKFPLLIVDRYLAHGQDGNEVIENLRKGENGIDRFFSVLYTSRDAEQITPTDLESYFHIQLRKDDAQALNKVSEALALSAFATLFNQIYKYRESALDVANQLVIQSGVANMIYLSEMAYAEGDTIFNVFNNWFDLLSDKKVQDELLKEDPQGFDLNFMAGLTKLIKSDFVSNLNEAVTIDGTFHQEVYQLATYEIFNKKVNHFCLPPAPGDIFKIDDQLYMLVGQECDLVVRSNGTNVCRNEQLAELIKCSFKQQNQDSKVDSKVDRITVNHFELDNEKGVLEITLGNKEFLDFRLLDLCCLNKDGISKYESDNFPKQEILELLPEKWSKYIPCLIDELNAKLKIQEFITKEGIDPCVLSGDYSFNVQNYDEDNMTVFPVRRIARVRGQFREYIMQRYWQYKTRKGLNTIGVYKREPVQLYSLQVGFPDNLQEIKGNHHVWIQLTGDRKKNKKKSSLDIVIMKKDLMEVICEDLRPMLEKIGHSEIIVSSKDGFEQEKILISKEWNQDKVTLKVVFPVFNEYADYTIGVNKKYALHDLFGKGFINLNPSLKKAVFVQGKKLTPMMKEGGALHYVKMADLVKGEIHLPDENIKLKLNQDSGKLYNAGQINEGANGEE